MIETVSVRLDEKLIREVKRIEQELKSDRSEVVRRLLDQAVKEWKLQKALELLRKEQISMWKAAEIAELTIYEILKKAEDAVILIGYTEKDLMKDIKRFKIWLLQMQHLLFT